MLFLRKTKQNLIGALIVSGTVMLMTGPANAATTTFTVTTLNSGAGAGCTGQSCATLRDALTVANALAASPGDDIRVIFDAALTGDIQPNAAAQLMFNGALGSTAINDYLGQGAFYHVNAQRPLTIDFDNRIGVVQQNDLEFAAFFVQSSDVVIENFQNDAKRDATGAAGFGDAAGIMGAATSIVIGGSRVTVRNGLTSDVGTDAMESCISLIDGASDILVEDYYCRGSALFAVYVDERATVLNVTLNRFETQDGVRTADILFESGVVGDQTTVNGLTITDSEFRSAAVSHTMNLRANAVANDLLIGNSRFLAANVPSINAAPSSGLGTVTVENNTATSTGSFFGTDIEVAHTGVLTLRGNTLAGTFNDAIFLQSPTSGTVIEDNQFLGQASFGNVAGVRIATGASGANNVIRNNLFQQAEPQNRFAIWMRANPGAAVATGWSIENNTVINIFGDAFGPIYNDGDGTTLISGNTFGEGTRGAVENDPAPENDDSFFVVNADSFSNGKIQTWRPTAANGNGSNVTLTVGPVDPPLPNNAAPATPVLIDVYYTATDKAEVYLGRVPGTHSAPVTHSFPSNATTGFVRTQITDANGRSSQYSAAVSVQATPTPPPPATPPAPQPDGSGLLIVRGFGGAFGPWILMLLGGLSLVRQRRRLLPFAVALGVLAPSAAQADGWDWDWTSRFYGGAMGGGLFTNFDEAGLTRALRVNGFNVDKVESSSDGIGYGGWLGYGLSDSLGLELSYTSGADERVAFSGTVKDFQGAIKTAEPFLRGIGDSYLVRLRYYQPIFGRWFVSPHLGIGMTRTDQEFTNGTETVRLEHDSFTWAVGGGVHYELTEDWSAGLVANHYQSGRNFYDVFGAALEWRFPKVLKDRGPVPATPVEPVRVVPVDATLATTVYFALDSAVLTDEARALLDQAAPSLKGASRIELLGHTDTSGTEAINVYLSQARAQAVLEYLAAQGVDRAVMKAGGYDASQPAASNETLEGRSRNRRTEIWVGN